MKAGQAAGSSGLAAMQPAKAAATPDWLWSGTRKLLPTLLQDLQALCVVTLLDAAANDKVTRLFALTPAAHQSLSGLRSTLATDGSMHLPHDCVLVCDTICTASKCRLTMLLLVFWFWVI